MTLLGWDFDQWGRIAAWAGSHVDFSDFRHMIGLRRCWLEAGGPMSGPSGKMVLA